MGGSQPAVENGVEVLPEGGGIERRNLPPALEQAVRAQSLPSELTELCHRMSAPSDDDALAPDNAVEDPTSVVAQFADRNLGHVSHRITV